MPFPEIAPWLKSVFEGFRDPEPISIAKEIKAAGGTTFDVINAEWYARNGYPGIYSILSGGMPAWSGEPVSIQTALNHSVVWACNRIISETVGMLPLVMLQKKGDEKQVADKHPAYALLHDAPSEDMTAMGFRSTLTSHTVLGGNAYAQIIRRSGTGAAIELHPMQPEQVRPEREKYGQRRLVYIVKEGNSPEKTYTVEKGKPHDILHIRGLGWDGLQGFSVIAIAKQSIGTALATERNVARFYANGGRLPYNLKLNKTFKDNTEADKFRTEWENLYSQPHRSPILEPWVDYQQTGLNMKDAQMLETRLFSIHEICRWFAVSPHLVGDLSRATFSNIEQLALEFDKMTISKWVSIWEQELSRCLLTAEERAQGYYFKHNMNSLLRGDFVSRMGGYSTMLQNGIASVNEVRDLEDWNPIDGGDDNHIQLNMQTLPGGTRLTSEAAALVKLGAN